MPAVTVIVPTRRRAELLGRAVASICSQTFTDLEIIVVDNNPHIRSVTEIQENRSWIHDKRVTVVQCKEAGNAAEARNAGLAVASGEWISFLDDDDEYLPNKIELQHLEAEASNLSIGLCRLRWIVRGRKRVRGSMTSSVRGDDLLLSFPGMPAVFHRRAPSSVRFNPTLHAGEDVHYFHRLLQHFGAESVFNVPVPLVNVYVQHDAHTNLNGAGGWAAAQATLRDFGSAYTASARRIFDLRARLGRYKGKRRRGTHMVRIAIQLARETQFRDMRLILNSFAFRIPSARRWIVS